MRKNPSKIMYLSPVGENAVANMTFDGITRIYKLPGTEIHTTAEYAAVVMKRLLVLSSKEPAFCSRTVIPAQ